MGEIVALKWDTSDFDKMMSETGAFKYQVKDCLEAATKDTMAIVNEDLVGEMRSITGLSAKLVKGRVSVRYRYSDHTGRVWIGLNPFPLKRLGPRQTRKGVSAGRIRVDSAFIVGSLGGNVFKRKGSERLPIEKQKFSIEDQGREVVEKLGSRVQEVFLRVLQIKLNGLKGRVTKAQL